MKVVLVALVLASQITGPIFRFETDGFWLNLHHFLYVLGRAEVKIADAKREAVAGAPADEAAGLTVLSEDERRVWREAVATYATDLSKREAVFDRELVATTNAVRGAPGEAAASTLKIAPAVAAALDRASPIYRRAWWTQHREANRAWARSMQDPIKQYGPQMLAYVTRVYQEPWLKGGYPVNVSAWSNWAGAYSTSGELLVLSSRADGNQGLYGFEITFHEAMHQWDEEIDARLMRIAKQHNLKFDDLLSHAMIFYTTGEAMRSIVPSHVPYAEVAGIWKGRMGVFKPALDAQWKPYLEGKGGLDEALLGMLK